MNAAPESSSLGFNSEQLEHDDMAIKGLRESRRLEVNGSGGGNCRWI